MPPSRRRTHALARRPRRGLEWSTLTGSVTIAAGANSKINLLAPLQVAGSSTLGCTVRRSVMKLNVTNFAAATDQIFLGLIVGRVSDVGVGATLPASDLELDWLWHDSIFPLSSGAAVSVTREYTIDTRAMRRVDELNETYVMSLQNNVGASRTIAYELRTLISLP